MTTGMPMDKAYMTHMGKKIDERKTLHDNNIHNGDGAHLLQDGRRSDQPRRSQGGLQPDGGADVADAVGIGAGASAHGGIAGNA